MGQARAATGKASKRSSWGGIDGLATGVHALTIEIQGYRLWRGSIAGTIDNDEIGSLKKIIAAIGFFSAQHLLNDELIGFGVAPVGTQFIDQGITYILVFTTRPDDPLWFATTQIDPHLAGAQPIRQGFRPHDVGLAAIRTRF